MKKVYNFCSNFCREMSQHNINAFASSTAFFIFLSLIPMLIMLCTIIPFTPLTEENLVSVITDLTPSAFDPLVQKLITQVYDKSAGLLSIAAVFTIWSAGKGVLALIRGLNAVNDVKEKRNYFVLRCVACLYTILLLVIIVLSLLIIVFGNLLVNIIVSKIPQMEFFFEALLKFRFLMIWGVLTLLFTLMYSFMPCVKKKMKYQVPGAAFSSLSWSIFSWCFSIYVDHYSDINAYGSLSIIILIMLWLYFCMTILLIGAYINCYFESSYVKMYERRKQKNATSPEVK